MKFNIITIFPDMIRSYADESILGRAQATTAAGSRNNGKKKIIEVRSINLRDFTTDKHQKVDDTPYGGGAGMVMKPDPIFAALESLGAIPFHKKSLWSKVKGVATGNTGKRKRTILMSPRGRQFDQRLAEEWSVSLDELTIVCGRYEGIDQRVVDYMIDEEISVGPYVLAGGELGALIVTEAISRLIPGVLGNPASLSEETFGNTIHTSGQGPKLEVENYQEYPQYTKPFEFNGWKVPDVLLSGDHKKINEWRKGK